MPKHSSTHFRKGKEAKGARYGVPEPGTVKSGKHTMSAYGPQKPLGTVSLSPKPAPASVRRSSSGRSERTYGG